MAESVARRHQGSAPSGHPGRHGHRQEPGLPGSGAGPGHPGGGVHRHQGPPGSARHPGSPPPRGHPRTCPSSSRCSRAGPTTSAGSGSPRWPAVTSSSASTHDVERAGPPPPLGPFGREIRRLVDWADVAATRRPGRAGLGAEPGGLGPGQRRSSRLPGSGSMPVGRHLLCGGGPRPGRPGRRGRRQHPPVHGRPGRRRRATAAARRGGVRRSPRARGHRVERPSASRSARVASMPWPAPPGRSWTTSPPRPPSTRPAPCSTTTLRPHAAPPCRGPSTTRPGSA